MRRVKLPAAAAVFLLGTPNLACAQGEPPAPPRGLFFAGDADGDGVITRAEFTSSRSALFVRLDADRDGALTPADRALRAQGRPDRPPPAGSPPGPGARIEADRDQDGRISAAEFDAAGAAMFDRMDGDGDGRVTRAEAEEARRAALP